MPPPHMEAKMTFKIFLFWLKIFKMVETFFSQQQQGSEACQMPVPVSGMCLCFCKCLLSALWPTFSETTENVTSLSGLKHTLELCSFNIPLQIKIVIILHTPSIVCRFIFQLNQSNVLIFMVYFRPEKDLILSVASVSVNHKLYYKKRLVSRINPSLLLKNILIK